MTNKQLLITNNMHDWILWTMLSDNNNNNNNK